MPTINYREFWALLKLMPGVTKEDLVWEASNCVTDSLKTFAETNPEGYNDLIAHMRKQANTTDKKAANKMLRSAILHRLQKHGVDTTNWDKVNAFLEQPRIAGKRLYDLSNDEMSALIPKLESILKKDQTRKAKENRQAQLN